MLTQFAKLLVAKFNRHSHFFLRCFFLDFFAYKTVSVISSDFYAGQTLLLFSYRYIYFVLNTTFMHDYKNRYCSVTLN